MQSETPAYEMNRIIMRNGVKVTFKKKPKRTRNIETATDMFLQNRINFYFL